MALFQKKIGPVFLKEDSDTTNFISKMQELLERTQDESLKAEMMKQINLAKYGEYGEQNISFELKNSGMDMIVLHDIYLEYGDLFAQIDYLVITRKKTFVIECKNLIGNIEIDNQGNFIRSYELFGKKIKEGIYSPITQNQRHLEIIRQVRREAKGNILFKTVFDHHFSDNYKSLVVLANPKTVLNAKYAKQEVKEQVIRADQIIARIKEVNEGESESQSEKEMYDLAEFFLAANKAERSDYVKKYEETVKQLENQKSSDEAKIVESPVSREEKTENNNKVTETTKICPKCGKPLALRTATKGENAGNKFWGCTGFPKCRYIENV